MSRFRQLVVAALLLCWLPATSHCALEAADVFDPVCCEADGATDDDHHTSSDHCGEWENKIAQLSDTLTIKAPGLLACSCLLCALALNPPAATDVPARTWNDAPRLGLTTWQFDHRTALPARAPSLV